MMILDKKVVYDDPDYTVLPFYTMLTANGWKPVDEETDSCCREISESTGYKITVQGDQEVECTIDVSESLECFDAYGEFGVMGISISKYPWGLPYTMCDLEDMANIIDSLEESLLNLGIPFVTGSIFAGRHKREKEKKNAALRKKLRIGEIEKKTREQLKNGEIKRYW